MRADRAVRVTVHPSTLIDGDPVVVIDPTRPETELEWLDGEHAVALREGARTLLLAGAVDPGAPDRRPTREVVVDGWRFVLEVEPEARALLRERATRGRDAGSHGGPVEVRAVIPGRIVAVAVSPGEVVEAGHQLLVVEAMKMQNEVRAPRAGTVERVAVAAGQTVELGVLLVVLA